MQRLNICIATGMLAALCLAGCTTDATLKQNAADQPARPPDAVIFISGMS